MRKLHFLLLPLAVGCSPDQAQPSSNSQVGTAANMADSSPVAAAKQACKDMTHEQMDVGISNYEACLGQRANLTRPASRELCAMAKSVMSADGACKLSE